MSNEARIARLERVANIASVIGAIGAVLLVAHLLSHVFSLGYLPVLAPLGTLLLVAFIVSTAADQLADRYRDADEGVTE